MPKLTAPRVSATLAAAALVIAAASLYLGPLHGGAPATKLVFSDYTAALFTNDPNQLVGSVLITNESRHDVVIIQVSVELIKVVRGHSYGTGFALHPVGELSAPGKALAIAPGVTRAFVGTARVSDMNVGLRVFYGDVEAELQVYTADQKPHIGETVLLHIPKAAGPDS